MANVLNLQELPTEQTAPDVIDPSDISGICSEASWFLCN